MSNADEYRVDEAIDLSSEHDHQDILSRFSALSVLRDQEKADLAHSLLVRCLVNMLTTEIPPYQIRLRCRTQDRTHTALRFHAYTTRGDRSTDFRTFRLPRHTSSDKSQQAMAPSCDCTYLVEDIILQARMGRQRRTLEAIRTVDTCSIELHQCGHGSVRTIASQITRADAGAIQSSAYSSSPRLVYIEAELAVPLSSTPNTRQELADRQHFSLRNPYGPGSNESASTRHILLAV